MIAAIIVLILLWDWNWFKRPIERYVHAKTGRELHIDGNLDVDLGRMTRVSADGLIRKLDELRRESAAGSKAAEGGRS